MLFSSINLYHQALESNHLYGELSKLRKANKDIEKKYKAELANNTEQKQEIASLYR